MTTNEYILHEDYAILRIRSKVFGDVDYIVDIDDVERLSKFRWAVANRHHGIYAQVNTHPLPSECLLHRVICSAPKGLCVDHINRNTLDNRKCNLRVCTYSENNYNTSRQKSKLNIRYIHLCDRKNTPYYLEIGKLFRKRYKDLNEALRARNDFIEKNLPKVWDFLSNELRADLNEDEEDE